MGLWTMNVLGQVWGCGQIGGWQLEKRVTGVACKKRIDRARGGVRALRDVYLACKTKVAGVRAMA